MTMRWDASKVEALMQKSANTCLEAVGHLMQNEMASQAHKDTGTLANSMNYKIKGGKKSGFDSRWGFGVPPTGAEVSSPGSDLTVRSGSNLVYAGPQEKHNGWASHAIDALRRSGNFARVIKKALNGS